MSLINQMLKDLEKRRSRDLETSPSLNKNIIWESVPNEKIFDWLKLFIILTFSSLLIVIGYLLWERSLQKMMVSASENTPTIMLQKEPPAKAVVVKPIIKKIHKERVVVKTAALKIDADLIENDDVDSAPPLKLNKIHRPLNSKQLAEISYNKGYQLLQQGRMHQGKEALRKALSLYIPHIKAREMLAGIYIQSGRFINAAELLSEGVKLVPEYPLFAQLYARVLLEQKNPQLAIQILERGAAKILVEPDYYALLAATYQRVKKHEKAIELYLQLVKVRSNEGIWWLGLGISLEKSGKNEEAIEAYQRAQKTGNLKVGLIKFTDNRVSALKEIGFPERY